MELVSFWKRIISDFQKWCYLKYLWAIGNAENCMKPDRIDLIELQYPISQRQKYAFKEHVGVHQLLSTEPDSNSV